MVRDPHLNLRKANVLHQTPTLSTSSTLRTGFARLAPSLPSLVGLFAFAVATLHSQSLLNDPDTYLHVAAGQWTLAHGSLPSSDPFSYSMHGAHWLVHEWFAELVLGATFIAAGWYGVILITAACFGTSLALLTRFLVNRGEPMTSLVLAVSAGVLLEPHMLARPHILALPILTAWCASVVAAREKNKRPSLVIIPLMTLWANLHGSFMVGLGLPIIMAIEAALERDIGWRAEVKQWVLFTVLGTVAAFINPNGVQAFLLPLRLMSMGTLHDNFTEWMSVNFHTPQPLELWLLGIIFVGYRLGLKLPTFRLLIVLGLVHLALQAIRHGDLLAIIAPLIAWPSIGPQIGTYMAAGGTTAISWTFTALARRESWPSIISATAMAAMIGIAGSWRPPMPVDSPVAPVSATRSAINQGLSGHVFNDELFGGYLIFNKISPFIDGRIELYGDAYLARYLKAERGDEDTLQSILSQYKIAWTMLAPQSGAAALIKHLPGWTRVYADNFVVIDRRDTVPER